MNAPSQAFTFPAIGTRWVISSDVELPARLQRQVLTLCEDFDAVWSRFRSNSTVTKIARAATGGEFTVPERDIALLDLYDRLVTATLGAVDPLVGRDLELLGYDAEYTLVPDHDGLSSRGRPATWRHDIVRDGPALSTRRPVVIDVGAAGKGFLVDLIASLLVDDGVDRFVVDGSGDLRHRGSEPLVVAMEHPTLAGRAIGTVELCGRSLCASATTRRAWGPGLHHILDGRTRRPVAEVIATWVVADDAATADGLATALFVADPDRLNSFDFAWARMLTDGRVQWSDDLVGEMFV